MTYEILVQVFLPRGICVVRVFELAEAAGAMEIDAAGSIYSD